MSETENTKLDPSIGLEPENFATAELAPSAPEVGEYTPAPVHRETARRATRMAAKTLGDAALAAAEAQRAGLEDATVIYTPRTGEYGYGGPGAASASLTCRVVKAHGADCVDLVALDKDGAEHALASCVLAGSRDTKAGDPGTFEVVG